MPSTISYEKSIYIKRCIIIVKNIDIKWTIFGNTSKQIKKKIVKRVIKKTLPVMM